MKQDTNRLLKLFYAGALVDAVYNYDSHGILEAVTEEKKSRQQVSAAMQLKQLEIEDLSQLYDTFSSIFGCAAWNFDTQTAEKPEARTTSCLLCAIAKKQGTAKPCDAFCINPFTAFADTLGYELEVASTLW